MITLLLKEDGIISFKISQIACQQFRNFPKSCINPTLVTRLHGNDADALSAQTLHLRISLNPATRFT